MLLIIQKLSIFIYFFIFACSNIALSHTHEHEQIKKISLLNKIGEASIFLEYLNNQKTKYMKSCLCELTDNQCNASTPSSESINTQLHQDIQYKFDSCEKLLDTENLKRDSKTYVKRQIIGNFELNLDFARMLSLYQTNKDLKSLKTQIRSNAYSFINFPGTIGIIQKFSSSTYLTEELKQDILSTIKSTIISSVIDCESLFTEQYSYSFSSCIIEKIKKYQFIYNLNSYTALNDHPILNYIEPNKINHVTMLQAYEQILPLTIQQVKSQIETYQQFIEYFKNIGFGNFLISEFRSYITNSRSYLLLFSLYDESNSTELKKSFLYFLKHKNDLLSKLGYHISTSELDVFYNEYSLFEFQENYSKLQSDTKFFEKTDSVFENLFIGGSFVICITASSGNIPICLTVLPTSVSGGFVASRYINTFNIESSMLSSTTGHVIYSSEEFIQIRNQSFIELGMLAVEVLDFLTP